MQRRFLLITIAALATSLLPALASAKEPVAKVLGQTIYSDDPAKPARGLDGQILRPLLKRFAEQERLTVTDAEVTELETALKLPPPPPGLSEADKAMLRQFPREMVLQWKVSKALYQRGGDDWDRYYPRLAAWLLRQQRTDGSWQGDSVGTVYGTSMALTMLQLPYALVPIHQR